MKSLKELEALIGKSASFWSINDVKLAIKKYPEDMSQYSVLSEIIKNNSDYDIYELIMPKIMKSMFSDYLKRLTEILEKYQKDPKDKINKEDQEKLKAELLDLTKNDKSSMMRLAADLLGVKYYGSEDFNQKHIKDDLEYIVKSLLSINLDKNMDLQIDIMTNLIYPLRTQYFAKYHIDLFSKEAIVSANKFEEHANKIAEEYLKKLDEYNANKKGETK